VVRFPVGLAGRLAVTNRRFDMDYHETVGIVRILVFGLPGLLILIALLRKAWTKKTIRGIKLDDDE